MKKKWRGPVAEVLRSQPWRRTGQLSGQIPKSRHVLSDDAEPPTQADLSRPVAPRVVPPLLCKPEVTGSIPVRSTFIHAGLALIGFPRSACRSSATPSVHPEVLPAGHAVAASEYAARLDGDLSLLGARLKVWPTEVGAPARRRCGSSRRATAQTRGPPFSKGGAEGARCAAARPR